MSPPNRTLESWLHYISRLHPAEIVPGLARVQQVAARLRLGRPAATVITVAGTNGKGSCLHTMEQLLAGHGWRVGAYSSPHIERFTERIRINGAEVDEAALTQAFAAVEQARGELAITFFEFTTLAALVLFQQQELDFALLEVGLGGRLDAVNLVAAEVSVITSIALDHQHWLGDNLEAIGREKAGIMREGKPVVLASTTMPESVHEQARRLHCPQFQLGRAYQVTLADGDTWHWQGSAPVLSAGTGPGGDQAAEVTRQQRDSIGLPERTGASGDQQGSAQAGARAGLT